MFWINYFFILDDSLGQTVKPEWELGLRSLGAVVYYLRYCLIDHEIMSLAFIRPYILPDENNLSRFDSDNKVLNKQASMVCIFSIG